MNKIFGKHLLVTNIASSGILMFVGDLIQQEIEFRQKILKKRYDWGRVARLTAVGFGMGPLHHYYYVKLDKLLPKNDLITVSKKILADQIIMSPVCILFFFYGVSILERKNLRAATKEIENKFRAVYMIDWMVWPGAQFINFYYMPTQYRVVYINVVTMFYNVFLSYIKHARPSEASLDQQQDVIVEPISSRSNH